MDFRRFERKDFARYQSWFKDHWLNTALGPMDEVWLEHILKDQTGAQYAIFEKTEMIAVLGLVWAKSDFPYHTITDLAIRPDERRKGWGRKILHHLVYHLTVPKTAGWLTYVDAKNLKAIDFMKKLNWELVEKGSMYTFRLNNGDL